MALNIKSDEAHRLARAVAEATGESMTEAVTRALAVRLDEVERSAGIAVLEAEVREILKNTLEVPPSPPKDGKSRYEAIREIVEPIGGFEIPEVRDRPIEEPSDFK